MPKFDTRLAARISAGVDARLRLAALVGGARLGKFLDEVLDQALPSPAELAEQVKESGNGHH